MNTDIHAVLDGFADNAKLQEEVARAGIPELEEWIPRLIDSLRGRDSDPERLAKNMSALFSALAARDLFLAALLAGNLNEAVPNDRKVVLSRALSRSPEYQRVIASLHVAIEAGDIIRETDAEKHTTTFRRKGA